MRLLEGSFTLYTSLSVKVSRIGAKLVCLSITSKQAKVAPECCQAVQGWKWRCPLVTNFIQPYLHQLFIDSHGLNGYGKPLKRPFDGY